MTDPSSHDSLEPLFALARSRRPDTSRAEYAFETRLLARLKAERRSGSVWAMVSWRMAPLFATVMLGLVFWQSQVVAQETEAAQAAYVENSSVLDSGASLDL